mgnify:CR=1 FL=1
MAEDADRSRQAHRSLDQAAVPQSTGNVSQMLPGTDRHHACASARLNWAVWEVADVGEDSPRHGSAITSRENMPPFLLPRLPPDLTRTEKNSTCLV